MPTTAKTGIGILLQRGDGATPTEVFTTLAMVKSIKGPAEEAPTIDVTSLDSTGGYAEFIPGLKSGGTVAADVNLDESSTSYTNLRADFLNGVTHNWQIKFPSPSTKKFSFAAFPSKLDHSFDPKAPNTLSLTLQVSGQVTLA
jgi:predicted secreted protein